MRSAALALGMIVLAGCAGPGGERNAPTQSPSDSTAAQGDGDAPSPKVRLPVDLIAADASGLLFRIDAFTGNASVVPISDAFPADTSLTSIRWGRDGELYGVIRGGVDALVRFDLAAGRRVTIYDGPLLDQPFGVAAASADRLLVVDVGEHQATPDGSVQVSNPRVVAVTSSDGEASLLTADPRFDSPTAPDHWIDIATDASGAVFVVTVGSDHRVTTPQETSDDAGSGAVWRVDATTGLATLVSSAAGFRTPESLTVLSDGNLVITEWADRTVWRVNPSSGATTVIVRQDSWRFLWGVEELPDGRLVVADVCSDPLNLTEADCGPGGLYLVDPATGATELLVSDPRFTSLSHVRVWPT